MTSVADPTALDEKRTLFKPANIGGKLGRDLCLARHPSKTMASMLRTQGKIVIGDVQTD